MKASILSILLLGAISASAAGTAPDGFAAMRSRAKRLAFESRAANGTANLCVYNFTDARKGFVVTLGDAVVGYADDGEFDIRTAPPALVSILKNAAGADDADTDDNGQWTPVAPIANDKGYVMWNQDSPFNDLCPEYAVGQRSPSGCVATAMAQVMFVHQWPKRGTGTHTYSPAILNGNTLTADFGSTDYNWDAMIPYYADRLHADGFTSEQSRAAVAELMLHCGVSVDMVYYTQSGATDYDVPPALVNYFNYDRGLAYRKREHYATRDWLGFIHAELEAGRPVLAYGRSASGGHAYVFDGMDANGFIHVNWGWGGMSNGYFNTSALTPPTQGIGGSDGGFNYSQRIITGIKPVSDQLSDFHVEITSTEALSAAKKKIGNGEDVRIKLTGKVYNHGWRDADFDYALVLKDNAGEVVKVIEGPKGNTLAMNATGYSPDFGNVNFGNLAAGEYTLYPAVRMTGGEHDWIQVRDEYIGYPNILNVKVEGDEVSFSNPDYFDLEATDVTLPDVIYSQIPALITTNVINNGDVEYHGEIKAVLMEGNSQVASTSNYIIDLAPGMSTPIKFTDAFSAPAGDYKLTLLNDDGQKVCQPMDVRVEVTPVLGNVSSSSNLQVLEAKISNVSVKATLKADGMFRGLLYAFIYNEKGALEQGCLYPEYVSLDADSPVEVNLSGEFENGVPGKSYEVRLATYSNYTYNFLTDADSEVLFVLEGESSVDEVGDDKTEYRYYDFNGFEVDPKNVRYYKKVKINK